MNDTLELFLMAWVLSQATSMLMLWVGSRLAGHRILLWFGKIAQRQKLLALEKYWPLTRIRPAIARDDEATCARILSSLIVLKSAASFAFGIVMVFWLPLACLVLPSIIAVHDGDNPGLKAWVRRVATLQLTSHALAAALGFAVIAAGPLVGVPLTTLLVSGAGLVVVVCGASLGFALAAGKAEASGLMEHGI